MAHGDSPRNLPGDSYRIKASDLKAEARQEPNAARRKELDTLAMAYLRLADQAERNSHNNIVYETPPAALLCSSNNNSSSRRPRTIPSVSRKLPKRIPSGLTWFISRSFPRERKSGALGRARVHRCLDDP